MQQNPVYPAGQEQGSQAIALVLPNAGPRVPHL